MSAGEMEALGAALERDLESATNACNLPTARNTGK
jgi:hypothetical protein